MVALAAASLLAGCSGLGSDKADVVVRLEAKDSAALQRTRQEVLASAGTWGGTRVGEETTGSDATALEFSLPGQSLDIALSALDALEADKVGQRIDVEAEQVDRTTTPPEGDAGADADEVAKVRLRVEVVEASAAPAGALGRMVLAVFSVIGMVATAGWILKLWRRRGEALERRAPRTRNIDRVDLREGPPTQETPQVPGWD